MRQIVFIFTCLLWMIISSCSSSEYAVNESRPRKNQKPSDHAVLFEFENAIGDNLEYWIEYLGNDTFLSCLHRFSVTEPDGSVFEHVFTVLGETRLPNIDSNRLEVLGWLSTIPSVRVGRDTFDIYVLQGYDTVGKHRSVHRKELIPAISSDYGTEYVEAEYFDKSRKILKISTDTGLTHIRFTNPERKMLTMYLVMLDLKRMLALDSVECKWLPIETVEFGQTLNE